MSATGQNWTWKIVAISSLFISASALLFSFSVFSNKSTPEKTIFEKKKECALLIDEAKNKMESDYKTMTPFFYDIFYSAKTDSCLYSYGVLVAGQSPEEIGSFILVDFFSGETLVSEQYYNNAEDSKLWSSTVRDKWREQVDTYK